MDEARRLGVWRLALSTKIFAAHLAQLQLLIDPRCADETASTRDLGMYRRLRSQGAGFGFTADPEDNLPIAVGPASV
jgi:hypothetical protein